MNNNMQVYSTDGMGSRHRLSAWNRWISDTFTSLYVEPRSDHFEGHLRSAKLSQTTFAEVSSQPASVVHPRGSQAGDAVFLLHLQLDGASIHRQYGRDAPIREGSFTLCHSAAPYRVDFREANRMLVLRIPERALKDAVPAAEDLVCLPVDGSAGVGALASTFIRGVWENLDETGVPATLERNLLDLIAVAYQQHTQVAASGSAVQNVRRLRIKAFIDAHLEDERLTPGFIARAFGISTVWLAQLFRAEGRTVGQYILLRRLQEAARRLESPLHRRQSISTVAYGLGFRNSSHFSRAFRELHGITPSEYRQQHAAQPLNLQ